MAEATSSAPFNEQELLPAQTVTQTGIGAVLCCQMRTPSVWVPCKTVVLVIIPLVHSSPPSDGVGVVQSKLPESERGT